MLLLKEQLSLRLLIALGLILIAVAVIQSKKINPLAPARPTSTVDGPYRADAAYGSSNPIPWGINPNPDTKLLRAAIGPDHVDLDLARTNLGLVDTEGLGSVNAEFSGTLASRTAAIPPSQRGLSDEYVQSFRPERP